MASNPATLPAPALNVAAPEHAFAQVGSNVVQGNKPICTAVSNTMARRIANALNRYTPDRRGT